ncbi:hypothetical protein G7Z17_g7877 [Cylindrodendrum hubeiense]|uniref:Myb-like domain-containing protein n=1 Tax=Cylindrodendrum hubeiense TaxID=595255 RepID=A0A9P5HCC5_9HYPO|nr:hypothetical protein G7Z17_g7877 [Cylindrodendrum hubeiense]
MASLENGRDPDIARIAARQILRYDEDFPTQETPSWTVAEYNDFPHLLRAFGSDWPAIAAHMRSKTPEMVMNYFLRQRDQGKIEWNAIMQEADAKRARGERRPVPSRRFASGPANRYDAANLATLRRSEYYKEAAPAKIEPSETQPTKRPWSNESTSKSIIPTTLTSKQGLISPRNTESPFPSQQETHFKRSRSNDPYSDDGVTDYMKYPVPSRGLEPDCHPHIPSVNQLHAQREVKVKNMVVEKWLNDSAGFKTWNDSDAPVSPPESMHEGIQLKDIGLGHETENILIPRQLYYNTEGGGSFTKAELELICESRTWMDPPALSSIWSDPQKRYQPISSQAAIEKFGQMCRDNDSVVSDASSCGTRRISCPSITEPGHLTRGNILKRLLSPPITEISEPAIAFETPAAWYAQHVDKPLKPTTSRDFEADPSQVLSLMAYPCTPLSTEVPKPSPKLKRSPSRESLEDDRPNVDLASFKLFSDSFIFKGPWKRLSDLHAQAVEIPVPVDAAIDIGPEHDEIKLETRQLTPSDHTKNSEKDLIELIATESLLALDPAVSEVVNHCDTTTSKPVQARRQIGLARIHIEILSLYDNCRTRKEKDDVTDSSGEESSEEINEDGGAETLNRDRAPDLNGPSEGSSSQSRNNHHNLPIDSDQGANSGRGNENNEPSRQPTAIPKAKKQVLRFACPYQAFETSQSCFRQAPRNPEGGCAGST